VSTRRAERVEGESKGRPASQFEAQNGLPHFLPAFSRLLSRRHGGATIVLFRAHGHRRCPPDRCLNKDCWPCLFGLLYTISSITVYLLHVELLRRAGQRELKGRPCDWANGDSLPGKTCTTADFLLALSTQEIADVKAAKSSLQALTSSISYVAPSSYSLIQ
jgi:hypothetical protein